MPGLKFYLFGLPRIEREGRPIKIERRKSLALAAYLALNREAQSRDTLAALLWPEHDQNAARSSLSNTLWQLKKIFGRDWLIVERERININPGQEPWVDINEFESLLAQGTMHDHPGKQACEQCVASLVRAVDLYQGDFMAGFNLPDNEAFEDWKASQNDKWCREFAGVFEKLVLYHDNQAEFEPAIHFAKRWLQVDPLNEDVHWHLMRLHARTGHPAAALRQYEECARLLSEELNIEPQAKLKKLHKEIKEQRLTATEQGPVEPKHIGKVSKPILPLGPCIGRDKELKEIRRLLEDPGCRLLTLVGPGGIGKTTLALKAVQEVKRPLDRIFFIPLAQVASPAWIVPAIADALGFVFSRETEPEEQLLSYLRNQQFLLILDNFEHLLNGLGVLTGILKQAPEIKLLVTSQQCLNLKAEWILEVQGLECPPDETVQGIEEYGAVRLLLQRMGQIKPGLVLKEDEKPFVVRICRFLSGIPLGIELAAAWGQMLSFREIAEAMEQDLAFLTSALNDLPDRHRSLQAVFERSWGFLTDEEKNVFKKLTIFRGGFSIEPARRVAGASLAVLLSLRDKFVLYREATERYEILGALRFFVDKKEILSNDDWEEARKLHAGFFASFSAEREDALDGENQNLIYAEIGEEIENIRAGWQWSVAHRNFDFISKYIKCLDSYYILKGWFSNGEKTFLRTIEFLKAQNPSTVEEQSAVEAIVGRFLSSRGWFCRFLARYEEASQALKESVAVFRRMGMEKELAGALYRLGVVMSEYAQKEEAKKHFEESYRIMQKQNDPRSLKNATRTLGIFYILCDDLEKAREMFETCLHLCIETGDRLTQVKILTNLGLVKEAEENYGEAVDLHQESLAICRQIGGLTSTVNNLINLGFAFLSGGRSQEARKCFLESLNLAGKTRVQSYIHEALLGLAALRSQDGENEIALEIVGHVCSHPLMLWMQRRVDRLISELKPKFDEEAFLKIMEKGKQRELDHYIKFFSC